MTLYSPAPPNKNTRPDSAAWLAAKAVGDTGERMVADVLRRIGIGVTELFIAGADLEITGRIEVKSDGLAHRTGHVAVETHHRRGRPSGISITTADTWAFVLGDGEIVLISTARLREAIAGLPDRPAAECSTIRLLSLATLRRLGLSIVGGGR